jgi:hypothetical protein
MGSQYCFSMNPVEERLALPFYLKMMGTNANRNAEALWDELVSAGGAASLAEVQQLLAPDHWRPVVMGAWFALRFDADEIGSDLVGAMERCRGSLTAPPLAIACALVLGRDAGRTLASYVERDDARDGSATFVSAVHELFCGTNPASADGDERAAVADMLEVGRRLRTALRPQ